MRLWFLFVGGGVCIDGDLLADCPLISDRCQVGGFEFSAGQKGGPECWLKTRAGISCHYLADYGMEACAGCYRNIRECGYFEKEDKVAVECPVAGDKCKFYSDMLIDLDDPDVPGCWKRDDEGEWSCLVLSKGCPSGFADITKCHGEVAEEKAAVASIERCPEVDDMCWHSERAAFKMGDENVPECWAVVDKSVRCRFKAEVGGRCPKGSFDTSHCHAASEAQIRECPGEGAKCVFEKRLYEFGEHVTPQCWQGTPGGFTCQPREDGCPDGMLDLTLCPPHRPPVDPRCPLLKDKCAIDGKKYHISEGPECWRRTEATVDCAFADSDGSCPKDYVLLATCPIREFPAVPILSTRPCPSPMDKCFDGKTKYFATDPTRPACWAKVGKSFLCINASPLSACHNQYSLVQPT
ncbi:hypothetical protein DSO57_1031516 [Entomophthora muscae]|uniref:Uncharacterized protein n=1 Tax=Entomophthora muscae TaxID=34485 RepID=A0ACC2ULW3_9FUNG|nr:hypothetical protein DSO57_1031516 [Entomophthora muscae]